MLGWKFFVNKFGEVFNYHVDTAHSYQFGACIINQSNLIDATLCRSTGRRDKDNQEIFKHDVVSLSFGSRKRQIQTMVWKEA